MNGTFRIATFVTDDALYAQMRDSFEAAGFIPPLARYTVQTGNPYETITALGRARETYVILVHQDVRCDQGYGAADLLERLDALTRVDSNWAVAGNAGGSNKHELFRHLTDPNGSHRANGLPIEVVTLDENFLILRTARRPHCSKDLSGFHLYGSDVCLNAAREGSTTYVIDFLITHLSAGKTDGLNETMRAFGSVWSRNVIVPRYVRTTVGVVALARPAPLRRLLQQPKIRFRFVRF